MTDDLEELKRNPQVLRVYGSKVKLTKEGDKYRGLCPFHSEKSGSFFVYKDMMCHCFGCNISYNGIQFLEKLEGISFKEAVERVKEMVGESSWTRQKEQVEAVFKPVSETNKTYQTFTLSQFSKYEDAFAKSQAAKDYLLSRGIGVETAQRLHTGFRQDVGRLAGEKNAHLADKGWLAFPCVSGDKVVSIKYRSIVEKAFCKQGGMSTELYNTESIDCFEDVVLVEGEIDCQTLEQAGFHAVSLASASSHPTPTQKDMLMKANRVFLGGDVDGGVGEVIMAKLWRELQERTFMLRWPEGMKDANQMFLEKCGGDVSIFRTEVSQLMADSVKQPIKDVYSLREVMMTGEKVAQIDHPDRLRFGWKEVDNMLIIVPGDVLSVFATQTGTGKTAFQMNVTIYNALKFGRNVLGYQCELNPHQYANITTAHLLKKNRNHLVSEDYREAAKELDQVNYYIGHDPMLEADEALDLMEAAIRRLNIDILVIDHINYLVRSATNEVALQAAANKRLKGIAQKHKVIVIVLGQPKKADNNRRGKVVQLQDLKGSATASDDVDGVLALHRNVVKSDDDTPVRDNLESKTKVVLLKARNKGEGNAEADLMFLGEFATFLGIDYNHSEETV